MSMQTLTYSKSLDLAKAQSKFSCTFYSVEHFHLEYSRTHYNNFPIGASNTICTCAQVYTKSHFDWLSCTTSYRIRTSLVPRLTCATPILVCTGELGIKAIFVQLARVTMHCSHVGMVGTCGQRGVHTAVSLPLGLPGSNVWWTVTGQRPWNQGAGLQPHSQTVVVSNSTWATDRQWRSAVCHNGCRQCHGLVPASAYFVASWVMYTEHSHGVG